MGISEDVPDDLVEVRSFDDVTRGEMDVALLRAHGIEAVLQGAAHRAMLGFLGPYVRVRLLVPASEREAATALLNALSPAGNQAAPPAADDRRAPLRRRRLVAFAFAILFPGGACFYAGSHVLGVALFMALASTCAARPAAVGLARLIVLVADLFMGLGTLRREGSGSRFRPAEQFWIGIAWWVSIVVVGVVAC